MWASLSNDCANLWECSFMWVCVCYALMEFCECLGAELINRVKPRALMREWSPIKQCFSHSYKRWHLAVRIHLSSLLFAQLKQLEMFPNGSPNQTTCLPLSVLSLSPSFRSKVLSPHWMAEPEFHCGQVLMHIHEHTDSHPGCHCEASTVGGN